MLKPGQRSQSRGELTGGRCGHNGVVAVLRVTVLKPGTGLKSRVIGVFQPHGVGGAADQPQGCCRLSHGVGLGKPGTAGN